MRSYARPCWRRCRPRGGSRSTSSSARRSSRVHAGDARPSPGRARAPLHRGGAARRVSSVPSTTRPARRPRGRERLAYEDAAALYREGARRARARPGAGSLERRLELLLELGSEQTRAARQVEARAGARGGGGARTRARPARGAGAGGTRDLPAVARRGGRRGPDRPAHRGARADRPRGQPAALAAARRARPGALLGRRRRALQRPRPRGARDGPAPRGPRRPGARPGPAPVHRHGRPRAGAPAAAREQGDARPGEVARRPRARAACAPVPGPGLPGARRGARDRCRARRDRAAGDRAAPADLRLERAAAAGDAGGDRRALRRRRAPRGRGARGGPPGRASRSRLSSTPPRSLSCAACAARPKTTRRSPS